VPCLTHYTNCKPLGAPADDPTLGRFAECFKAPFDRHHPTRREARAELDELPRRLSHGRMGLNFLSLTNSADAKIVAF
jgi:hypothetical protein